jgi:hypothetical protein
MAVIFFLLLVFKHEGGITITTYGPLLELARFYSYEGFD